MFFLLLGETTEVIEKLNKVLAVYDDVLVGGNVRKSGPTEAEPAPATLLDLGAPQQDMLGDGEGKK